ncbi:MAG TPA: enoyl-CoA hydratase-related protein [Thermoanaerobaculia bacterium]|nr:enoyl-CoA hydratase-related protein [Thermoanaerobaculia bacterium]
MDYKTLLVEQRGVALHVMLNRPDVHNAFNDELIREAVDLFSTLEQTRGVRAVVLRGGGQNFCAGADLNWMAKMVSYGRQENIRDASLLAKMFAVIDECPIPVIGRIQGAAIGGGVGLVAVCDIAISMESSKFGLSEVKLGILPAVISPYVIGKIGASHARALFLTGERFSAARALSIGLVHRLAATDEELDSAVDETVAGLTSSGPEAVAECKKLIDFVASNDRAESIPYTIEAISQRRVSAEGQEGMSAFLRKEKPEWTGR